MGAHVEDSVCVAVSLLALRWEMPGPGRWVGPADPHVFIPLAPHAAARAAPLSRSRSRQGRREERSLGAAVGGAHALWAPCGGEIVCGNSSGRLQFRGHDASLLLCPG